MPAHRKPSALKLLEGTARADRMNPAEPSLDPELLPCPDYLPEAARAVWAEVSGILFRMGVLTVADPLALESLARTVAEVRRLRDAIEEEGYTFETVNEGGGRMIRANPLVSQMSDAEKRLLILLGRFGMTPADRSKVSAAPKADKGSAWDAIA